MLSCFRGKVSRGFHAPLLSVRNIQFLLTFSDGTLGAICWAFGKTAADRATGAVFRTEYYRTTSGGELTHHLLATCCWLHSTFWILPILYLLLFFFLRKQMFSLYFGKFHDLWQRNCTLLDEIKFNWHRFTHVRWSIAIVSIVVEWKRYYDVTRTLAKRADWFGLRIGNENIVQESICARRYRRVYISYTSLYWRRKSHIHRECIIINKCSIKNAFCFFCCFSVSFCSDPFCSVLYGSVRFILYLFVCVWAILKLEVTRNKVIMPPTRQRHHLLTGPKAQSSGESPTSSNPPQNLFLMSFRAKRRQSALQAF